MHFVSQGQNAPSFIHLISSYAPGHCTLLLIRPPFPDPTIPHRHGQRRPSLRIGRLHPPLRSMPALATMAALPESGPDPPAYQPNIPLRNRIPQSSPCGVFSSASVPPKRTPRIEP
jgi:hypothetical protein